MLLTSNQVDHAKKPPRQKTALVIMAAPPETPKLTMLPHSGPQVRDYYSVLGLPGKEASLPQIEEAVESKATTQTADFELFDPVSITPYIYALFLLIEFS